MGNATDVGHSARATNPGRELERTSEHEARRGGKAASGRGRLQNADILSQRMHRPLPHALLVRQRRNSSGRRLLLGVNHQAVDVVCAVQITHLNTKVARDRADPLTDLQPLVWGQEEDAAYTGLYVNGNIVL